MGAKQSMFFVDEQLRSKAQGKVDNDRSWGRNMTRCADQAQGHSPSRAMHNTVWQNFLIKKPPGLREIKHVPVQSGRHTAPSSPVGCAERASGT